MSLPNEADILKPGAKPSEELEVDIEGAGVEVEVVDDTPPEDRNRKPLPEGEAEPTEEEMEQYSEAVKRRIAKMKHAHHDERRAKEAALREREEAVAMAQRLLAEKKALESRYVQGEDAFISQAKEKSDLAMEAAKREYKAAYELGDADKMADAQEKMALIATERKEADIWAKQSARRKEENTRQQEEDVVQRPQPSQAQAPELDPDAKAWAAKNRWFGSDDEMTQFAYGVHAKLVKSGIDPAIDTEEYYTKLDKRMRAVFPEYEWGDTAPKQKQPASVVAPVARTTKAARRITLTQSQVTVARRMGITPEQYAAELAKLEK